MNIASIIIIVVALWYIISKRNSFNTLRRAVQQQGSDIGIQIAKRTACLNDALNIAKLSYSQEVAGIEKLTASDQLTQLAYLGEKYPQLQSIAGYNHTLQQAFALNAEISSAQELLDGNIRVYNDEITTFPGLLVAKLFRYKVEKFVDEDGIEQNKKLDKSGVDFSMFR